MTPPPQGTRRCGVRKWVEATLNSVGRGFDTGPGQANGRHEWHSTRPVAQGVNISFALE